MAVVWSMLKQFFVVCNKMTTERSEGGILLQRRRIVKTCHILTSFVEKIRLLMKMGVWGRLKVTFGKKISTNINNFYIFMKIILQNS